MTDRTARIRKLNDAFRTTLVGGRLMLTRGIVGREDVEEILQKVRAFDSFNQDNDPYQEHDFGAFEAGNDSIFWKIDYYDPSMTAGTSNAADPSKTTRVLTVMRADEY